MLLGSLRSDDADVNDSGKKARDLDLSKTTTLHVHHAFLYISLPSFHDYNMKVQVPNFMLSSRTGTQHNFLFLFLNFDTVL